MVGPSRGGAWFTGNTAQEGRKAVLLGGDICHSDLLSGHGIYAFPQAPYSYDATHAETLIRNE